MTPKVKQLVITITVINFLLMCYVAQNYYTIYSLLKTNQKIVVENDRLKADLKNQKKCYSDSLSACNKVKQMLNNDSIQFVYVK